MNTLPIEQPFQEGASHLGVAADEAGERVNLRVRLCFDDYIPGT